MKQFFTLISAMLLTISLFAQSDESARRSSYSYSKLSITTMSNTPVKVVIDGISYNKRGNDNDLLINDIKPGNHSIKIYQQKNFRSGNGNRVNNNMQLIYERNLYVKARYHIDISINRFGRAFIDEKQMNDTYYATYDDNDYNDTGWDNNQNYSTTMNSRSFDQFKETLRNESFDNSKLVLAKQTIASNYFSAAQVKELVQLFSYENSKLDIAKYSYKYTVDKNNYFTINDAFSYSSSKEELARFIQAYK